LGKLKLNRPQKYRFIIFIETNISYIE